MNIALIHDWITNLAGAEKVLLNISEIYPEAPIFTSVFDKNIKAFQNKKIHTSFLQNIPLMKTKRELLIPLTPFAFEQFDLSRFDLVISNTTMAAKGVLTKPKTMHICYCNTPPRYLWEPDIDTRAKKGLFSGVRSDTIHKMRIWDKVASDRVDFYFANSKYIAKRIKKYYKRNSVVIYPPVETKQFKISSPDKIEDYYLYVSRLVSYKKCEIVIEAFNDLKLPLKIIGQGPEKTKLMKMAKSNIEFLGYLSDKELLEYYSRAKAFIFAAEEDFGIVPVEAMASGRPVIAYGAGGSIETILPGVTGLLFNEQTPQCLIDAVSNFKPDDYDPKGIKKHSETFSVERFKREFKTTVDDIVSGKIKDKF